MSARSTAENHTRETAIVVQPMALPDRAAHSGYGLGHGGMVVPKYDAHVAFVEPVPAANGAEPTDFIPCPPSRWTERTLSVLVVFENARVLPVALIEVKLR